MISDHQSTKKAKLFG